MKNSLVPIPWSDAAVLPPARRDGEREIVREGPPRAIAAWPAGGPLAALELDLVTPPDRHVPPSAHPAGALSGSVGRLSFA